MGPGVGPGRGKKESELVLAQEQVLEWVQVLEQEWVQVWGEVGGLQALQWKLVWGQVLDRDKDSQLALVQEQVLEWGWVLDRSGSRCRA